MTRATLTVVAVLVAVAFAALGTLKVLATRPMVERAEHLGYSATMYRYIGALELAGAAGVVTGLAVPPLGSAAAAGLLLLLAGALTAHIRNRDTPRLIVPAVVMALAVAGYLIEIPVDACGAHEFHRAAELIDVGRQAAVDAFDRSRLET